MLGGQYAYEHFHLDKFQKTQHNAKALYHAQQFDPDKSNLFIYGPTGSGKTHLAVGAIRKYLDQKRIEFIKTMEIYRELRSSENAREETRLIAMFISTSILVIDDLGISKDTEFSLSVLYEIIDGRYMNDKKGLIVTSNLSFDELATKMGDDRIPSRLYNMCTRLSLVGEKDHRIDGNRT